MLCFFKLIPSRQFSIHSSSLCVALFSRACRPLRDHDQKTGKTSAEVIVANNGTQDAASSPTGYGAFERLPTEVRREIWRHLLLVQYNTLSGEPIVNSRSINGSINVRERHGGIDAHSNNDKLDNQLIFSNRRYDLCPTILHCSKAIYNEASDVMYRENLFVRFHQEIDEDQWSDLLGAFLRKNSIGAFRSQFAASTESLAACNLHAMDVYITFVEGQAYPTDVSTRQFIIPASSLFRIAVFLHSMVLDGDEEDHFGDINKLSLQIRNEYSISEQLLYKRLLAPFEALRGFREAMISGIHCTPHIKRLETSLAGSRASIHTEQNVHEWFRQLTKSFYTTYEQYNTKENWVAELEAWKELDTVINFGSRDGERVDELGQRERIIFSRMSFWVELKSRKCEFKLLCLADAYDLEPAEALDDLDDLEMLQESYGQMAMGLAYRGQGIDTGYIEDLLRDDLKPEKHIFLACRDLAEFCQYRKMTADAVMYLERCKQSTLWNDELDLQLDVPNESEKAIGWKPGSQTDFVHGDLQPEDWIDDDIEPA